MKLSLFESGEPVGQRTRGLEEIEDEMDRSCTTVEIARNTIRLKPKAARR